MVEGYLTCLEMGHADILQSMFQEDFFIFLASLSAFLSSLVVLTGLIWPGIMLSKCKPFSTIIFFISFADCCGSIINCLGFPQNGSSICSIQACAALYFAPASWLWSLVLVYQLRTLIIFKSIQLSMKWTHFICWSIPLLPTLLPLTTNSYGQDDSINGSIPCVLGGDRTTKFIWIGATNVGIAFLSFVFMVIWTIQIHLHISNCNHDSYREQKLLNSMIFYPVALFVTWFPNCVCVLLINARTIDYGSNFPYIVFCLSSQYGTLLAIIFFSGSSVSRMLWLNLLRRICLKLLRVFGSRDSMASSSRLSMMVEDEKLIDVECLESMENLLVLHAMEGESNRLRNSTIELRESSVINIIM